MNCKFCNAEIPEGKDCCPACGKSVIESEEKTLDAPKEKTPDTSSASPKSSSGVVIALVCTITVLVIMILCICVFMYFKNNMDNNKSNDKEIYIDNSKPASSNDIFTNDDSDIVVDAIAEDAEVFDTGCEGFEPDSAHTNLISDLDENMIESHISNVIRPLYSRINSNLNNYSITRINPEITVWHSAYGTIAKKSVVSGTNGYDLSREYYYDENGDLAFAYMFKGSDEYRLYFQFDKLIRYIDNEGTFNNPTNLNTLYMALYALEEAYDNIVSETPEFIRSSTYSPAYTYKNMTEIHDASLATDAECYEMIEFVTKYNNLWINFVNYGDDSIYAYLRPGMQAYRYAEKYSSKDITEEYELMEVNDVRKYGNTYYVWTHEIINELPSSPDGAYKEHDYHWIYKIGKDASGYYVENYISDPYYK